MLADITNLGTEPGAARDARLRFRSTAHRLDSISDRPIRLRAFDVPRGSHPSGVYTFEPVAGGRTQIAATFELTGLSRLLVRSATPQRTRAKLECDLDDLARRFAFEFSPPLPIDIRAGRVHR